TKVAMFAQAGLGLYYGDPMTKLSSAASLSRLLGGGSDEPDQTSAAIAALGKQIAEYHHQEMMALQKIDADLLNGFSTVLSAQERAYRAIASVDRQVNEL